MRIALTGNPNSGKTTMFNVLTGKNEKVGNWAGVTVESVEHPLRRRYAGAGEHITLVDLPGAYSMSPFTSEESVTSTYVKRHAPDAIINIVDATNISRSLFFTTQLLELDIPVVVALNKTDINRRKKTDIDVAALSQKLGCPVVETTSTTGRGLSDLLRTVKTVIGKGQIAPFVQEQPDETDRAACEAADRARFAFVDEIVKSVERREVRTSERGTGDRIDAVLTNRWVGLPIFAAVMLAVFWISQSGPAVWLADWLVGLLETGKDAVAGLLQTDSVWTTILVDGIIGGLIAVVGFLPLVMIMYFLIALLEDCGYMARATVVLDPIFKRVGLSGKSVISFIIGTGCAIPGIMASRTIRDERERRATAMLTPFMPCGAKLPVITLFVGSFFPGARYLGALMYFVGIALIFLCALLINKLTGYRVRKSYFIIELPEYKWPSVPGALASMCRRGWSYIVKAGTIILVCNFVVQLMQSFDWNFQSVTEATADTSILATIAGPFAYLIAPFVGVVAWQMAAAVITGFIAKENVVGTLAVCYGISSLFNLDELAVLDGQASVVVETFGISSAAALAFMMFNLFSPPCFAAIGAMRAEMKSGKWLAAGIGLQLAVGYMVAFLVYFFGTLLTGEGFASVWMPVLGWAIVAVIAAVMTGMAMRNSRRAARGVK